MKLTFYKDNKLTEKHTKTATEIITEYNETEASKLDMPFERKLLNHMMVVYGSFDKITDEQWNELYNVEAVLKTKTT